MFVVRFEKERKDFGCEVVLRRRLRSISILVFRRMEKRTINCSHSQASTIKECQLCRIKKTIHIDHRLATLKKIPRHQSTQCLNVATNQ